MPTSSGEKQERLLFDFYRPAVIDSKTVTLSDSEDRFSMLLANKSLFRKSALDSDYKSSQFRVDDQRRYTIAQTTRIQEIPNMVQRASTHCRRAKALVSSGVYSVLRASRNATAECMSKSRRLP